MLQTIVNKANLIPSVSAGTEKQLVKPCDVSIYTFFIIFTQNFLQISEYARGV